MEVEREISVVSDAVLCECSQLSLRLLPGLHHDWGGRCGLVAALVHLEVSRVNVQKCWCQPALWVSGTAGTGSIAERGAAALVRPRIVFQASYQPHAEISATARRLLLFHTVALIPVHREKMQI